MDALHCRCWVIELIDRGIKLAPDGIDKIRTHALAALQQRIGHSLLELFRLIGQALNLALEKIINALSKGHQIIGTCHRPLLNPKLGAELPHSAPRYHDPNATM